MNIFELVIKIAEHIFKAITEGDEQEWEKIAAILPDPLASEVRLAAEDEKTRKQIRAILGD